MVRYSLLRRFYVLLVVPTILHGLEVHGGTTCGASTYLDNATNQCFCGSACDDGDFEEDSSTIRLAGIMDTTSFSWAPDIFAATVQLINEGFWPGTLKAGEKLEYDLRNAMCDETTAVRAYWELRTLNNNAPPHGIVGTRCSGPCTSLARVSGLEAVPHLSPASNTARLSDKVEFPFFSRLVAPNNENGEAGTLAALLRALKFERITILETDTVFAKDLTTEFRKVWVGGDGDNRKGEIVWSSTIRTKLDGTIDLDSVSQALDGVPTDNPSANSRVIFLAAHNQHAFKILEYASSVGFQQDTIWVGPSSWVGRSSTDTDFSWLPAIPGYIGVSTPRNRDSNYQNFLERFQDYERSIGKKVITDTLPPFAAETVDSIVALTKAISDNGVAGRRDGAGIVRRLRQVNFEGVSGQVRLTEQGDRKDPQYAILQAMSGSNGSGDIVWTIVGSTGNSLQSVKLDDTLCFAKFGCVGRDKTPSDSYPVPPEPLPWWVISLVVLFAVLFLGAMLKYWRSRQSKRKILEQLEVFRKSVVGMRTAEIDYIPNTEKPTFGDIEEGPLTLTPYRETAVWCWRESESYMDLHRSSQIYGDPKHRWIKYDKSTNKALEEAYQNKQKNHSVPPGYVVNFQSMKQTKIETGFVREVKRHYVGKAETTSIEAGRKQGLKIGDNLPGDIAKEPRMVLVKGDVVQISTERTDGWAFGRKLHHADEATARELLRFAIGGPADHVGADDDEEQDDVTIFTDSGWFQLNVTRIPLTDDLSAIRKNVGDASALDPPKTWDPVKDKTVVQLYTLKKGSEEREAVERAFKATVCPPEFSNLEVLDVQRSQNLAMWQSYVVKRQTICYRDYGEHIIDDEAQQRDALDRFERRWLWHGTSADVMDKILQQGFNRSFCGKNATLYGKGVYFARDASYSANTLYSVPDRNCVQYMMACRVAVGEFCRGKKNVLTPDVRDKSSQSLYDTTVDKVSKPSIYVTYHDAQAYPEYLISFKTN